MLQVPRQNGPSSVDKRWNLREKKKASRALHKNTTIQDLMTGPHISEGPKGQRIWDFSKDLPTRDVLEKGGHYSVFQNKKVEQ